MARPAVTTPALLTRIVTVPKAFSAASNAATIAARSRTSASTAIAPPPAFLIFAFTSAPPPSRGGRGHRLQPQSRVHPPFRFSLSLRPAGRPAAPPAPPRRRSRRDILRNGGQARSTRPSPAQPCREDRRFV